jgi:hypothetical protein
MMNKKKELKEDYCKGKPAIAPPAAPPPAAPTRPPTMGPAIGTPFTSPPTGPRRPPPDFGWSACWAAAASSAVGVVGAATVEITKYEAIKSEMALICILDYVVISFNMLLKKYLVIIDLIFIYFQLSYFLVISNFGVRNLR